MPAPQVAVCTPLNEPARHPFAAPSSADLHPTTRQVIQFEGRTYRPDEGLGTCKLEARAGVAPTLLLSGACETDYFDIAAALCEYLLEAHDERDTIEMQFLLATPLSCLQRKGLPVDVLLESDRPQKPKPKPATATAAAPLRPAHSRHTRSNPINPTEPWPQPRQEQALEICGADVRPTQRRQVQISGVTPNFQAGERRLQQDLRRAVKEVRNSSSASVNQAEQLRETVSCESEAIPASRLQKVPRLFAGLQLYLEYGTDLSPEGESAAGAFSVLLQRLAGVFGLGPELLNMYRDIDGNRIAFNRGGCLFFNLRYYEQCHGGKDERMALSFWYTTLCHELAHNTEPGHNALHENIMEGLIAKYLPKLMPLLSAEALCPGGADGAIDVDAL